jgi:hypothetical protein
MGDYNIIGIIVHAKDEKKAFAEAKKILNKMEELGMFEYYSTFDEETTWKEDDWECDWGHLPAVVLASSPEGKHFIEAQLQHAMEKFRELFEEIKSLMPYLTPELLMHDAPLPDVSEDIAHRLLELICFNYFHELTRCPGGHRWYLYHEYSTITAPRDLKWALEPPAGLKAYVVPVNLHY